MPLQQKVPFVRMYAYLSGLVTLIIAAVSLMQIVIHFTLKVSRSFTTFASQITHFFLVEPNHKHMYESQRRR